ncbi:19197_t:CDS:2, partial [Racocetra fulgida]
LAASPSMVVLNISNYEWTEPTEINPIGPLTGHTSIMFKNYMITAFDVLKQSSKSIYKLDTSDPLTYKWILLSSFTSQTYKTNLPTINVPSFKSSFASDSSPSNDSSPRNGAIIGIGVTVGVVAILSFAGFLYYRSSKNNPHGISIPTPGTMHDENNQENYIETP